MASKGKPAPLPPVAPAPVSLTTQYPGELWADMDAEVRRRLAEEHRDDSMADLIRESVRAYRAAGWGRVAQVA